MKKPVLVVMAAGMGSRYGGLKQIDPVDKEGHIIMDFSIYDAVQAGFQKVVFIIKKENETDFSAQKASAFQRPRFSEADEHQERPQGHQGPPRQGPR